jgi:hypothetical protein
MVVNHAALCLFWRRCRNRLPQWVLNKQVQSAVQDRS